MSGSSEKSLLKIPLSALQLPERPKEIHRNPCKHCPSAHYPPDPEALDTLDYPRDLQIKSVFPCAWRPQKMCKGVCDFLSVTEEDLNG
jgi:hypothetical protein